MPCPLGRAQLCTDQVVLAASACAAPWFVHSLVVVTLLIDALLLPVSSKVA